MSKNNYTVYKLTNKINGKIYIGITSRSVSKRWNNGNGYKGQVIGDAIAKYGWVNFEKVILVDKISQKEAFKMEQDLIKKYKTQIKKYGYNRSAGGESGSFRAYNVQYKRMVKTYQYDLDGNFLKEYPSIEEAKRQLNVTGGNISACCNGYRKIAHGYRWFHEFKGEKIEKIESKEYRIKKSRIKEIY